MPTSINIFRLDTPVKSSTIDIYKWCEDITVEYVLKSERKSVCDFWNENYNVSDDYRHNYNEKCFEEIFEEDDMIFLLRDGDIIIGTIVGKVRPFICLKSSIKVVVVDFLCVSKNYRSNGVATKLIQSLAYWYEKNDGLKVHIFHRELSKCPYWALSGSVYYYLKIGLEGNSKIIKNEKSVKHYKKYFFNFVSNDFLKKCEKSIFYYRLILIERIYRLINSQNWDYKLYWKSKGDFIRWITRSNRYIINFDEYICVLEDVYIETEDGKLGEIVWSSGKKLEPKYKNEWFDSIHTFGFGGIVFGSHLENVVPDKSHIIYSGSSWYYLNNFNYIPGSKVLMI